jgi:hypothetical protein
VAPKNEVIAGRRCSKRLIKQNPFQELAFHAHPTRWGKAMLQNIPDLLADETKWIAKPVVLRGLPSGFSGPARRPEAAR